MNFDERPFVAIWETTQACDLACVHCRACAQPAASAGAETAEAKGLIDEIAAMEVPVFVLTGGDPLKRPDIFELVRYAANRNVRISLTPSATPLLTRENIVQLKECGLARLAVSLDGPTAEIHDAFRRVLGSYDWTLNAVRWAREIGLPVQINTTITRHNLGHLDDIIELLCDLDITLWSVFFLVPTGRDQSGGTPLGRRVRAWSSKSSIETSTRLLFDIKSTEAQHYRRFLLQRRRRSSAPKRQAVRSSRVPQPVELPLDTPEGIGRAPRGINDGKGMVFISHLGEVFPADFSLFQQAMCGRQSLAAIYRDSPLFRSLRDSHNLEGKCGDCEFREICGGSRARAYALTGNLFAEDPCCIYEPDRKRLREDNLVPA